VDINQPSSKLSINLKQKHILLNGNAKIHDSFPQLTAGMEETNGYIYRWVENCTLIETKSTQFRFWNRIAEVQHIQSHPLIQNHLLYMPV